ncbi:MAG: hypothetical protein K8R54_05810 [Bacteroidales bacterium]|nr:hypothetical protein [Bacteroidales bacterium]
MNSYLKYIFLIAFISIFSFSKVNAQCIDLVKHKGFTYLDTSKYIPEARFNALPLREGDDVDIYKSFFKGRNYRIVVVAADNMPKLNFKVTNFQRQTLYDSKITKMESWDFVSDKNQNLIISVEVPKAKKDEKPQSGCVAVIVGFSY